MHIVLITITILLIFQL